MKIVIDIPEERYVLIKRHGVIPSVHDAIEAIKAILNGALLPKGHGRLIDANVLADGFEDNYEFCEVVNATPTIIEADKEGKESGE